MAFRGLHLFFNIRLLELHCHCRPPLSPPPSTTLYNPLQVRWLEERGAYRLLGVSQESSEGEVKKRYHRLSLKAHPDKGGDAATFLKLKVRWGGAGGHWGNT